MVSPFNLKKIKFPREYIIGADIHGNLSAFNCFLDDVESMHRERIGNALIQTVDPSSNEGKEMRQFVTYLHKKHRIDPTPGKVKSHRELVLDDSKRKFNDEVSKLEATLQKPFMVFLGDGLGYYFQSKPVLDLIREKFDLVCRGNHERNVVKASSAPGMDLSVLARFLGTGPYATKSTATVLSQLNKDDIAYLKSLHDVVRIRGDMVGRHCHYVGEQENPMYPISEKLATQYGYFEDPSQIEKFCLEPLDIYDRPDTFIEDEKGKVNKEIESHSHLPNIFEINNNGDEYLDVVPGDFALSAGGKTFPIYDFYPPSDHFILGNSGSLGLSRRNDTHVRDNATQIYGSEVRIKQLYYLSVIEDHFQARERWYNINSTGTLAETLAVGMLLRKEDQEWHDNYAMNVLNAVLSGAVVLSEKDQRWYDLYGERILNAKPIEITPEVRG